MANEERRTSDIQISRKFVPDLQSREQTAKRWEEVVGYRVMFSRIDHGEDMVKFTVDWDVRLGGKTG